MDSIYSEQSRYLFSQKSYSGEESWLPSIFRLSEITSRSRVSAGGVPIIRTELVVASIVATNAEALRMLILSGMLL